MTPEQLTGKDSSHLILAPLAGGEYWVHPDVTQSLTALIHAAKTAGFDMRIASGVRDYQRQQAIWNGKFEGRLVIRDQDSQPLDATTLSDSDKLHAILHWSALPGASRHHWGTDFDVYAKDRLPHDVQLQLEPWEYDDGHQKDFSQWLENHLAEYGFFYPYKEAQGGVAIEPWHISHRRTAETCLADLSVDVLREQLRLDPILGQPLVMSQLEQIYTQYVTNIYAAE